ncbi:MAG: MBL fold metallo-hydrolase [Maribacter sp.]
MCKVPITLLLLVWVLCCSAQKSEPSFAMSKNKEVNDARKGVSLIVLGTVQDAGAPHIACQKACCALLFEKSDTTKNVVSLGLVDADAQTTYLVDATPDITQQLHDVKNSTGWAKGDIPSGIFLTHAHIGHYSGLMYLGKEATNTSNLPVYAMPKMKRFLEQNGPWSQLVSDENIVIIPMLNEQKVVLSRNLTLIPITVPHRDEFSETVGYRIIGPQKSVLFVPDIDKWSRWGKDILEEIKQVDYAFLDATFYDSEEINTRDMAEIPHPFVVESMALFKTLSTSDRQKIHFIHVNHTNPLLDPDSAATKSILENGFSIARKGMVFQL